MRRPSLIPPNLLPSLPTFDMPALEGFLARFGPHGGDDNEEAAVACPPIEAEGYKPKGVFKELFGYQCYVVRSPLPYQLSRCSRLIFMARFDLDASWHFLARSDQIQVLTASSVHTIFSAFLFKLSKEPVSDCVSSKR